MQMEHSEYIKLQTQLQDHFDGRYRKIDDCNEIVEPIKKGLSQDYTRLAVIEQQNKLILWVLTAITSGIITMLVKMFFGN